MQPHEVDAYIERERIGLRPSVAWDDSNDRLADYVDIPIRQATINEISDGLVRFFSPAERRNNRSPAEVYHIEPINEETVRLWLYDIVVSGVFTRRNASGNRENLPPASEQPGGEGGISHPQVIQTLEERLDEQRRLDSYYVMAHLMSSTPLHYVQLPLTGEGHYALDGKPMESDLLAYHFKNNMAFSSVVPKATRHVSKHPDLAEPKLKLFEQVFKDRSLQVTYNTFDIYEGMSHDEQDSPQRYITIPREQYRQIALQGLLLLAHREQGDMLAKAANIIGDTRNDTADDRALLLRGVAANLRRASIDLTPDEVTPIIQLARRQGEDAYAAVLERIFAPPAQGDELERPRDRGEEQKTPKNPPFQ